MARFVSREALNGGGTGIIASGTVPSSGVTSDTAKNTQQYLSDYNTNREQKIQDMYSGNLASQNAQQKTAYDKNMGALKTAYDANLGNLKTAYDNNTASLKTAYDKNLAQIADTYQQNMSDAEAYRAGISPRYQESMNALGAEYERQRRNNNMQAAVNGINTGAGSQLALGQSMAYQRNQGNLSRSEVEALNEAERGISDLDRAYRNQQDIINTEYNNNVDRLNREYANQQATYGTTYQNNLLDLKTNYQNKIAEAAANNDYQRAAALLDEYGAQYDRTMQQAQQLAEYGDFSVFANIYGIDAAQQMEKNWSMQNPELAYNLGRLTAEDYFKMTGKQPAGVTGTGYGTLSYGGGGGWSSGSRGGGGYGGYSGGGSGGSGGSQSITWDDVAAARQAGESLGDINRDLRNLSSQGVSGAKEIYKEFSNDLAGSVSSNSMRDERNAVRAATQTIPVAAPVAATPTINIGQHLSSIGGGW